MITERENEILERAIKVSAYSDDDALLILRGLLMEREEFFRKEISALEKENFFLKHTLAKFEGVQDGSD